MMRNVASARPATRRDVASAVNVAVPSLSRHSVVGTPDQLK